MTNQIRNQHDFIKYVEAIVDNRMAKTPTSSWKIGTIRGLFNPYFALVEIQGMGEAITIPTNPDVRFYPGDQVLVLYINGDKNNKYVMSKCSIPEQGGGK